VLDEEAVKANDLAHPRLKYAYEAQLLARRNVKADQLQKGQTLTEAQIEERDKVKIARGYDIITTLSYKGRGGRAYPGAPPSQQQVQRRVSSQSGVPSQSGSRGGEAGFEEQDALDTLVAGAS
jgi:hypothetical protein